jgi:hypothetical protein
MANILTKAGISSGSTVQAGHITQSIDAFTSAQAYDITLSGSLVVTGSVILDTNINKNFQGTASNATTSSYALTGFSSPYALTTAFADNETTIFQLYSYQDTVFSSSQYYIGVGNFATSSIMGLVYPYDGTLVGATITSNIMGATGSIMSDVRIHIESTYYTFTNTLNYVTGSQFLREPFNAPISPESRIFVTLDTNSGTQPQNVIHNINLYIKRNG